jgi:hypothetical protein
MRMKLRLQRPGLSLDGIDRDAPTGRNTDETQPLEEPRRDFALGRSERVDLDVPRHPQCNQCRRAVSGGDSHGLERVDAEVSANPTALAATHRDDPLHRIGRAESAQAKNPASRCERRRLARESAGCTIRNDDPKPAIAHYRGALIAIAQELQQRFEIRPHARSHAGACDSGYPLSRSIDPR